MRGVISNTNGMVLIKQHTTRQTGTDGGVDTNAFLVILNWILFEILGLKTITRAIKVYHLMIYADIAR